jgi:hypothetical protein
MAKTCIYCKKNCRDGICIKLPTHHYCILGWDNNFENSGHSKGWAMKILTFRGGLDFHGPPLEVALVMAFPATK